MLFFMETYSIYIHIPFCKKRCSYCDFNTYAGMENKIEAYVIALCKEIALVSTSVQTRLPVHTIFIGGGTPSMLSPIQFDSIMQTIKSCFNLVPGFEATFEANPGTVSLSYLRSLRTTGLNRVSFGMQSASPTDLSLLGRIHNHEDVINAVKWARQAGFLQINLDLIFGLPFQTMDRWQQTIDLTVGLNPEHLSLYALTVEKETSLYRWVNRGLVEQPDDDLAADMYEWASDRLASIGFQQYEISNWARTSANGTLFTCKHNLQYWHNLPYLGFGAGAHGYAGGYRLANVPGVIEYVNKIHENHELSFPNSPATSQSTKINSRIEIEETMMVGLRLTEEGVSKQEFKSRFGVPVEHIFGKEIKYLEKAGLLENHDRLRLTKRGRLLGNQVFMQFISSD
jgi:oxygen-independent coproporphyrinogen III oxidase